MKKFFFKIDILYANIFTFVVFAVLGLITVNLHFFDPFKIAFQDFEFTDLVYSQLSNEIKEVDTNIILVNIGNLDREGIAEQIEIINNYKPKVIGIDAFFSEQKKDKPYGDSLLKYGLEKGTVVLAGRFAESNIDKDKHNEKNEYFTSDPYFGKHYSGHVNLIGEDPEINTVRLFYPKIIKDNDTILSFSLQIAKLYNKNAYSKLMKRNKDIETINFTGNLSSYICFDWDEITEGAEDLKIMKDKIVLLGYLGHKIGGNILWEDKHFSPLNERVGGRSHPDMYGSVIMANILSMILHDNYLNKMPMWIALITAFIICYFHIAIFMYFYVEKAKWYHVTTKMIQLISSILFLWLIFVIYKHLNYKINATPTIVAIVLSADIIYFYDEFMKFLNAKFKVKSYILKGH